MIHAVASEHIAAPAEPVLRLYADPGNWTDHPFALCACAEAFSVAHGRYDRLTRVNAHGWRTLTVHDA